jgi:flagellin
LGGNSLNQGAKGEFKGKNSPYCCGFKEEFMAVTIGSNISSINAQNTLSRTTRALGSVYEKLSSGQRINRASDDAAGLAVAERLKADSLVARVAQRNANDGISVISIADSALSEIGNALSRLAELASQAANGTITTTQRSALAAEFTALGSEIQRIAVTTEFNDVKLISNGAAVTFQVGTKGVDANSVIILSGVQGTLASLSLGNVNGALTYSINDTSNAFAQSAAQNALDAVKNAIGSLTQQRGTLGSTESRLNVAISNLMVARENFLAAEGRIRDADIASEAAELTRLGILQQAGASVLAQANQQPALALSLLG